MSELAYFDLNKNEVGKVELPDGIFGVKPNPYLIQNAVRVDQNNRRQGNASTKTRANVRGGGKKPYKQKGTGRARRGTNRSPICVGGGKTFGPLPREYKLKMNKKVARSAIKSAISLKKKSEKIIVLDNLNLADKKTKTLLSVLKNFGVTKAVIVDKENENLTLASRNLRDVKFLLPDRINVIDVLKYDHLIFTKASLNEINGVIG